VKNGKFPFEKRIKNKVSMSMNEYLIKKITMRTYVVRLCTSERGVEKDANVNEF
jgi:hypothetical protein